MLWYVCTHVCASVRLIRFERGIERFDRPALAAFWLANLLLIFSTRLNEGFLVWHTSFSCSCKINWKLWHSVLIGILSHTTILKTQIEWYNPDFNPNFEWQNRLYSVVWAPACLLQTILGRSLILSLDSASSVILLYTLNTLHTICYFFLLHNCISKLCCKYFL